MPFGFSRKLRSSLGVKIAAAVTVPIVLVIFLLAYFTHMRERQTMLRTVETHLLRAGENLKGPAESFLKKGDYDRLRKTIAQEALEPDISHIALYGSGGKVVGSSNEKWQDLNLLDLYPDDVSRDDLAAVRKAWSGGYAVYYEPARERYSLAMPIYGDRDSPGAMLISMDVGSVEAGVRQMAAESAAVAGLVSVALGVSIYLLFHSLFIRRIKSVSSAAVRLASGDLNARAASGGAGDEIGHLAASFNLLAEDIAGWRGSLEATAASRLKELSVLYEVVDTISQSLELGKVLPKVLDRVLENVRAGKGAVVLLAGDGRTLSLMASRGLSEEAKVEITTRGQGCVGDVILRKNPLRVPGEDQEEALVVPGLEQDNIMSALVVPITMLGNVLGVIAVYGETEAAFSEQDEALLSTVGNQVAVAVENARLYEKTLELAQMDGLTGLANRRYLMERLRQEIDRAQRYQTSLSVIMLDLDAFKSVNDTYGHLKGDELLRAFSATVKESVRCSDIAGRYGGEEFCIVLPNTCLNGAGVIAERIRKAMEKLRIPLDNGQPPVGRTVSIGIAEFTDNQSVDELLGAADTALYRAKEGGRNRVVW